MRWVIRLGILGLVLVGLLLGGLALWLPRLVERPEVRERIAGAAREATGRELSWKHLEVALLPPRLLVQAPLLADPSGKNPPLRAERLSLRVALLPLLRRTLRVDAVSLDGLELPLVRTGRGVSLPGLRLGSAGEEPAPAPGGAPTRPDGAAAPLQVAVRAAVLRDGRVILVDRTVSPPATWALEKIHLRARDIAPGVSIPLELEAQLQGGGSLSVQGEASPEGSFELEGRVSELPLARLAPYLGGGLQADGTLQLQLQARGVPGKLERGELRLTLAARSIAAGEAHLQGELPLHLSLAGPWKALAGSFELDGAAADIDAGQSFHKPRGEALSARGRIASLAPGDVVLDDVALRLGEVAARARIQAGARTRLRLDAEPFELSALAPWLPSLAEAGAEGSVALQGLQVSLAPLRLRGQLRLDGVGVPLGQGRARLSGTLVGEGDALVGQGLDLRVADQPFRVDVRLAGLSAQPHFGLRLSGKPVDSNALVAALAGRPELLSGPLELDTDLRGVLGSSQSLLQSLHGTLRLRIAPGTLHGVSLLRSTFDRLGSMGEAALLAGRLKGGSTLQQFYEDRFELLSGTLQLADGRARTDDLRLDYPDYRAELRGSIGLTDLSLDLSGKLILYEKIDQALAAGAAPAAAPTARAVKRVISLSHVGGTLDSPRVELTPETVLAFASAYALEGRQREKLRRKIDRALGEGAGEEVLDTLQSIFGSGGGRR